MTLHRRDLVRGDRSMPLHRRDPVRGDRSMMADRRELVREMGEVGGMVAMAAMAEIVARLETGEMVETDR